MMGNTETPSYSNWYEATIEDQKKFCEAFRLVEDFGGEAEKVREVLETAEAEAKFPGDTNTLALRKAVAALRREEEK